MSSSKMRTLDFGLQTGVVQVLSAENVVQAPNDLDEIDRFLITKEAYWSAQLFSLAPHGLNKRKEFHFKNRICYN